jgi:hypothetical protein
LSHRRASTLLGKVGSFLILDLLVSFDQLFGGQRRRGRGTVAATGQARATEPGKQ